MADTSTCPPLTRESVLAAHEQIKPFIHQTPVATCKTIDNLASTPVSKRDPSTLPKDYSLTDNQEANPQLRLFFKCENNQKIGAFKARGAFHALTRLVASQSEPKSTYPNTPISEILKNETHSPSSGSKDPTLTGLEKVRAKGVITHSSGNHAQALALAASTFRIPAHIVMPSISTPSKIAGTKSHPGVRVVFSGSTSVERESVVDGIQKEKGCVLVPPYDHPDIMLGQGTMGVEFQAGVEGLLQEEEEEGGGGLDIVVAPIGGGGMLSGICTALQGTGIQVYGAEPNFEGANDAERGLREGKRVEKVSTLTIADGLRTPVGLHPWAVISDEGKCKGVYSVSEEEIKAALRLLMERAKLFVEPSAAVPLAVVLFNEEFRERIQKEAGGRKMNLGIILSGGNTTVEAIAKLFEAPREVAERAEGTVGIYGEKKAENVAG